MVFSVLRFKKNQYILSSFDRLFVCLFVSTDLIVVVASIIVLSIGSNGQVFATSAIRYVCSPVTAALQYHRDY